MKSDPLVARYRERLKVLPTDCKAHLDLLNRGGKLRLRPEINEEPDGAIRQLFLEGFLAPNLLSGFYKLRNLLVYHLLNESTAGAQSLSPIALLRRSANERVASLLQDAEISLRALLMTTLRGLASTLIKELLAGKKTEKRLFEPELKKKLLDWANAQFGEANRDQLSRFLSEEAKAYDATHTLWDKVCVLYREDRGEKTGEPTPAEVADYLTFNELADVLITLGDRIFTKRDPFKTDAEQPGKRWQGYLSTMRRLRNRTAHLRNVGFQELEDLLSISRTMRSDLARFA